MLKLSELNEEYKKMKGEEIACIILYIHMPTGEEEVIVNSNVNEKIKYINKTYNEDLIHNSCKDIYITDVIFGLEDIEGMEFKEAFELMKKGYKVKLPSWDGYWCWDTKKESIIIHCKDGNVLDIRETKVVDYTFSNICSDEWIIATGENTPLLGGEATFNFSEALKYLKRGLKIARKGWNGKGLYVQLENGGDYKSTEILPFFVIKNTLNSFNTWVPSVSDLLATDYIFVE